MTLSILEAQKIVRRSVKGSRRIALLTSFEPLFLETFLQAHVSLLQHEEAPVVERFGFDQLEVALRATEGSDDFPFAVLVLDWQDFHPALSWRSHSPLSPPSHEEFSDHAAKFLARIDSWLASRSGLANAVVLPSPGWLPLVDSTAAHLLGPQELIVRRWSVQMAEMVRRRGGFLLEAKGAADGRWLFQAGCPVNPEVAEEIASSVSKVFFREDRKKIMVVDLDGTIWDGVLAEDGVEGLRCGETPEGWPYLVFQKFLLKLKSEGIHLAYASKNLEEDVVDALQADLTLIDLSDFSSGRAGWMNKSLMIEQICLSVGVGVDSAVFVDDNPTEIAEVESNLPTVECLRTPTTSRDWLVFFEEIQNLFWTDTIRVEDQIRTDTELQQKRSSMLSPTAASGRFGHLNDLDLVISVEKEGFSDPRCLELVNKTNQFNMTGRRLTAQQWSELSAEPGAFCWKVGLRDRFGSFGTIGVAFGRTHGRIFTIENLVVSCRALGRGVEFLALDHILGQVNRPSYNMQIEVTRRNEPAMLFAEEVSVGGGPLLSGDGSRRVTLNRNRLAEVAAEVKDEGGVEIEQH